MPNKFMKWDLRRKSRNLIKSVLINELTKRVKKHKVRREGKASSADHAIEISECLEKIRVPSWKMHRSCVLPLVPPD